MSLSSVRPFFRTRLNALGYTEHNDAFDDANRPQQRLEKLYRIQSGDISGNPASGSTHEFDFDITIVITLKGKLDNVALSDRAIEVAEEILEDVLQESVRLGTDIKDIQPTTIAITPYSESDDNDVILAMSFNGTVLCNF